MTISSVSVKELALLGAKLEITPEGGFSAASIKEIILIAAPKGQEITIHAGKYSAASLKEFVMLGKGFVRIVI